MFTSKIKSRWFKKEFKLTFFNNFKLNSNNIFKNEIFLSPCLGKQYNSTLAGNGSNVTKIRNIGIIAHIDAGKTTTTERMLYYSGFIKSIGDVDDGDTVMDYLPAERERGITITSAAISFNWANHQINLIDTPGHADFNFEVIRSIRVLDGAVTILDGVAGVESQTETVWNQAKEFKIPQIIYINKMDRVGAAFAKSVQEITIKLNSTPAILNFPYFSSSSNTSNDQYEFSGVIDVIEQKLLKWEDENGDKISVLDIPAGGDNKTRNWAEEAKKTRQSLIEALTDIDDELVEKSLEMDDPVTQLSSIDIRRSLRKATISNQIVPVLCGSSFKNTGVQPLMDAIIQYLPSPIDRPNPILKNDFGVEKTLTPNNKTIYALAFKVVHDDKLGFLTYIRVYSGILKRGEELYNVTTGLREKVGSLFQPYSNKFEPVSQIHWGNIVVMMGARNVRTGDTLTNNISSSGVKKGKNNNKKNRNDVWSLQTITIPPPVFVTAVIPYSPPDERLVQESLDNLLKEDPSLNLRIDKETDQFLLGGMGELHLEISKDRLIEKYKARARMGQLEIAYKETITVPSKDITVEASHTDQNGIQNGSITLNIVPIHSLDSGENKKEELKQMVPSGAELVELHDNNYICWKFNNNDNNNNNNLTFDKDSILHSIRAGLGVGLSNGILGLPVHSVMINIKNYNIPMDCSNTGGLNKASQQACQLALKSIPAMQTKTMEPVMNIVLQINDEDMGIVMKDLTSVRCANVYVLESILGNEVEKSLNDNINATRLYIPSDLIPNEVIKKKSLIKHLIKAKIPLKETIGYLKFLRSATKGRGTFIMNFDSYQPMNNDRQEQVMKDINGY